MTEQSSEIPAVIGDYAVLGELARDEGGVVLRARQTSLDRIVALKVLRAESVDDPADLGRLLRGARAAARLDHPHIVRIFDVGRTDDLHYYAMTLVEGESLTQRVASRGPLSPREAAELVRRVAQATAYTHTQQIVHRGLSPDCVLLDSDGKPRVTGFGLARLTTTGQSLTATGLVVDPFSSPESVTGTARTDSPAADIYGLGGILYFALTGRPPHSADSIADLATSIADSSVIPPRQINPKVPRNLEAICLRCLATQPADRYPTAQAVVDVLSAALGEKVKPVSHATGAGNPSGTHRPADQALGDTGPIAQDLTHQQTSRTAVLHRSWLRWGAAGIAAIALLAGAVIAMRSSPPKTPLVDAAPTAVNEQPSPAEVVAVKPSPEKLIGSKSDVAVPAPLVEVIEKKPINLLNGIDLSGWVSRYGGPATWNVAEDYIEANGSDIRTTQKFGSDFELHVEFWVPKSDGADPNRGNSGIYLQGRHEIQIIDGFENPLSSIFSCGALYREIGPTQNVCKRPEEWQSFDITFHAPRKGVDGQLGLGYLTEVHNGVTVIDNVAFPPASSPWGPLDQNVGEPGPILLQYAGNKLRFRNLVLRELPSKATGTAEQRLVQQFVRVDHDLIGSLTSEGWTFNNFKAAEEFERVFRENGMAVIAQPITELAAAFESKPVADRNAIKYWLTRWELCATAAKRPEAEPIRTLLGILEDDPWGQQFLAARSSTNPAALIALATSTSKKLLPNPESNDLLIESLFARGLDTKVETIALVKAVQAKFRNRYWPNIRLAQVLQPTAMQATKGEQLKQIAEIASYLRLALASVGGENAGLTARIAGIESLGPSPKEERSTAEWILAKGGTVLIWQAEVSSLERMVYTKEELPATPFQVYGVSFSNMPITDADLAGLHRLPNLKRLYLDGTQVTDTGVLELLKWISSLQSLSVENTAVTDRGVSGLASLQELFLRGTTVTDAKAASLRRANGKLLMLHSATMPAATAIDHAIAAQRFAMEFDRPASVDLPVEWPCNQPLTIESLVVVPPWMRPSKMRIIRAFISGDQTIATYFSLNIERSREFTAELWRADTTLAKRNASVPTGSDSFVPVGVPVHVAAVFDGRSYRTFVNGKFINSDPGIPMPGGQSFRFSLSLNYADRLRGRIAETRISSIARYENDFVPAARHEPDEHTLALYHFDEGEGGVVKDSSGHGHDGKIIGNVKWIKLDPYMPPTPAAAAK